MKYSVLFSASLSAIVAGLSTSAGASPSTFEVVSVAMTQPAAYVLISSSGPSSFVETAEVAPLELTVGGGKTLLAFCVDIWHPIALGAVAANYTPTSLVYQQGVLTTNSSGTVTGSGDSLSSAQIGEVGGLAKLGYSLERADVDPDLGLDLSAIQTAIWSIENPTVTFAASAPSPGRNTQTVTDALNTQIAYYETWAVTHQATSIATYYDTTDNTQGLVTPTPEPATWALMLLGLGVVGATVRSGRPKATVSSL